MKNLIIIGARGFGREAYNAFVESCSAQEWRCKGFLDTKSDALDGYEGYPPIIGDPETYNIEDNDFFFCALGDVKWRKHYVDMLKNRGATFTNIIANGSYLGRNVKIGEGCFIGATISCDSTIGDFTFVFGPSTLGHDVKVGKYCHIGTYSFLGGFVQLEDGVTLHPGAKILPHKIVKSNSVVGAGSVVIRNVPENTSVMGVPAKKIIF